VTDAQVRARVVNLAAAGSGNRWWAEHRAARSVDLIYGMLVGDAGLFCHAFFGWKKTPAQRARLRRLWARAQRIATA
jgi:hypothetical protein